MSINQGGDNDLELIINLVDVYPSDANSQSVQWLYLLNSEDLVNNLVSINA